jgi:hypothetical protein
MSNVDDLISFGKNARNILEDATFKAVIESVKSDIHNNWKLTSPHESKERERHYQLLQAVDLLEEKLWAVADNAHILKIKSENIVKNKKGV